VKEPQGRRWLRRAPLLPALVLTIAITQAPGLLGIWYSFQSWNLLTPGVTKFVGFANYATVIGRPQFRTAVLHSIVLTVTPLVLSLALGTLVAVLLDRRFFGRGLARTLMISPFLVMPAAATLIWKFTILDPVFGLLNWALRPFGAGQIDWASAHPTATLVTVLTWQWTPFMMLIVLAGLQSQGPDVLEAAHVDGAGAFRIFRSITVPHLRPYLELGVLLGGINIAQSFEGVFMITQGGPGTATTTVPYYLYLTAFREFEIGTAAALGVIVLLLTTLIAMAGLRLFVSIFSEQDVVLR
jgi:sorbitol/mannitol transport system permease protein